MFLLSVLIIQPLLVPTLNMLGGPGIRLTPEDNLRAPPVPQGSSEWIDVSLEVEYSYDDTATISWTGRPATGPSSPFNPLYNWTKSGSIEGGIYDENPGNATIIAIPWDNLTTAAEVADFLNYTMENYVRYTSWPSLSIFNFTEYENTTLWVFNDTIASHLEFFNTTLYHVVNATAYLVNGFNATGIIAAMTEYRIYLEWFEAQPIAEVTFSYTIENASLLAGDIYNFSLGRAMGLMAPLNLTGSGSLTIRGPYNRMITDGSPASAFVNKIFPYFPIGDEIYDFNETEQEFDYNVWYKEPISDISISREVTPTGLNRGGLIAVTITVINTGDVPFAEIIVGDVIAIETGMFQLVSGTASIRVFNLEPGANITLEYTAIALVTGVYDYPAVQVAGIDMFSNQFTFTSTSQSLTIGNGLTPNEIVLIQIAVALIIIVVVLLVLYRFRRRIF